MILEKWDEEAKEIVKGFSSKEMERFDAIIAMHGKVIVDGKTIQECNNGDIKVTIEGDVNKIDCGGSVEVHGNAGSIDCGGCCEVSGDVKGDMDVGGSVICGNVSGDIAAGGSVRCKI